MNSTQVSDIKWWHQIRLPDGTLTPGRDSTQKKIQHAKLPPDLAGKSVLDVGAWDGAFSFEAERRGASRVVALDSSQYRDRAWDGFDFAKRVLGSKVEKLEMDVMDISPASVGVFDVVFFLGVLYHLPNPMLGLQNVTSVTRELLIVETHTDVNFLRRPAAAFYPGAELSNDASNWWGPNVAGVNGMLRSIGFDARLVWKTSVFRGLAAAPLSRRPIARAQQGRAIFHARKIDGS
jgi:tRNA (mo5U34)-methyltransferase